MATRLSLSFSLSLFLFLFFFLCLDTTINSDRVFTQKTKRGEEYKKKKMFTTQKGVKQMRVN